ncbi:MAG: cation:proton antiporter family protein [Patescibacteria group bacterium]
MENIFFEITLIIILASFFSILFKFLKQPAILAYILTGIIIGPFGNLQLQSQDFLKTLGELGITFLLFMVGLELRFSDLKSVGKISLLTGIGQILFTSLIGYSISLALGFSQVASLYIAVALTFSSTIIIVKLLSDKKDLQSLYGKIAVGFLLVQDFFAILFLIFLSSFSQGLASWESILFSLAKGIFLFALVLFLSKSLFPKILDRIASSPEVLFLFSIAWALGLSALVASPPLGFSIEIGGFLAGLALANSSENFQIIGKVKSLRDFFITIFFVILGMSMSFTSFSNILFPVLVFSLFILIGNPIIVMIIMGLMGFRKRTSFLAGLTVAQISEFSLIIVFLGQRIGHLSSEVVSLVTAVGVITFAASTYLILNGDKLYKVLSIYLSIFEKSKTSEEYVGDLDGIKNHVVLIGVNRMGTSVLNALLEHKQNVLAVDFNPDVIKNLKEKKIKNLFGDIADLEIQERANLASAKLIISTVSDIEDNMVLISEIKKIKDGPKIVVIANDNREEEELYKVGANYVIQPYVLGGKHLAHLIKTYSLFRS